MMASVSIFTACSSDNSSPSDVSPNLNFIGGTGYVSDNVTLTAGSTFKVGLNASANSTSGAKLTRLTVTRIFDNKPFTVLDTTFSLANFTVDVTMQANFQVGQEAFYFKVYDKDGQSKEISFTVNTTPAVSNGPINTYSTKILGAQGNTTGSSFASVDGTIYTLTEAMANSAKIDWLYFNGSTNHATIAAPDDPAAASVYNGANGPGNWAVKNPTRFKKVTDAIDWAAITDDGVIKIQTETGVDQTKINNLAVGDYLAFITATGKKGLIKVESISGTDAGTITISVKVQQ